MTHRIPAYLRRAIVGACNALATIAADHRDVDADSSEAKYAEAAARKLRRALRMAEKEETE